MAQRSAASACSGGREPWYARVTLDDVEVVAAADGSRAAWRVLGVPLAGVACKDVRAICAKLAVAGYRSKRKAEMERLIAAKKAVAEWAANPRGARQSSAPATSLTAHILPIERSIVAKDDAERSLLARDGSSGGDSVPDRVAGGFSRRPPRLQLSRGRWTCATPSTVGTAAQCRFSQSPRRQDVGCQASADSPLAARRSSSSLDSCSTSGSSSAGSDVASFLDALSPPPDTSSSQDTEAAAAERDEDALEAWFKVSDRISALRATLKAERDQEIARELRDDIAFLVRKKRRIVQAL